MTHYLACDCREAVHREVAEALADLVEISDAEPWAWHEESLRLDGALGRAAAVLKKYREVYP